MNEQHNKTNIRKHYIKFNKMVTNKLLCLLLLAVCATAYPWNGQPGRYMPQRTIMVNSGYYGHPLARRSYMPEGTMTMFASGGDQVATNSFMAQYPVEEEQNVYLTPPENTNVEETEQEDLPITTPQPQLNQEEAVTQEQEESIEITTVKPKKTQKRKQQKPKTKIITESEENDEDEPSWPFQLGRGGPSYNAFFPINFATGATRGRQGYDGEEGYPQGSATAIANAFSTGKGGVASSHATAFGDPGLSSLFLRKHLQKKNKNSKNNHD